MTRETILREIRRLAEANEGQAPGQNLFARETNIAEHQWRGKLWTRWGDALAEAGFQPNMWNERLDSDSVLNSVIAACRHFQRLPTFDELMMYRKSDPSVPTTNAIRRHFGTRPSLIAALARRARDDATCADIAAMLPNLPPETITQPLRSTKAPDGSVYLIQSGDFFKIGRSDDIERRIKEIRVALPDIARVVHFIQTDDPPGIEAYWHQRFKEKRANGEWFKLDPADVAAFKRRKFQ